MVAATSSVVIRRDPATVFDYFADLRNEPQWNRGHVRNVVLTSAPPIGLGSTFEGEHVGFGRATWRLVAYERPHRLVIEGVVGKGTYHYECRVNPRPEGCQLQNRVEWEPGRLGQLFAPLLRWVLRFQSWRSFRHLRRAIEAARPVRAT